MSTRKILVLAIVLPTLGAVIYSMKYSGKACGGENANSKEYLCPRLYECVLESNKPNAIGACRFLPNGVRFDTSSFGTSEVKVITPQKDPVVEYNTETKKAQRVAIAHNKFGFELLKILSYNKENENKNVLVSPTSIELALSIIYNGANGPTKDQLASVLQISSFGLLDLNESSKILISRLTGTTGDIQSSISNSVWVANEYRLTKEIEEETQNSYNGQIASVNFSEPTAPKVINDWISANTDGKIKGVVPSQLNSKTAAYIVNAVYFNGIWKNGFNPDATEPRDFTKQTGEKVKVPTMQMKREDFLYAENALFQIIKLPYGTDTKYSMVILLPKDQGINNLLGKLSTDNWHGWLSLLAVKSGTIYLPKFSMEYTSTVTDALKEMGLNLPFDPQTADFSGLFTNSTGKRLYINDILHKTYIDVNENGTEAAAATTVGVVATAINTDQPKELPFTMTVDKPFMFAVVNEETQANLFIGIVREL